LNLEIKVNYAWVGLLEGGSMRFDLIAIFSPSETIPWQRTAKSCGVALGCDILNIPMPTA